MELALTGYEQYSTYYFWEVGNGAVVHQRVTSEYERMIVARDHRRAGCIPNVRKDRRRASVVTHVEERLIRDTTFYL